MMIDKHKLIVAVKSLLQEEMIEQEEVPIIKSYIDNNDYVNLYGKLKWELADSDIYYNGKINY
jgi:predicted ATP-dependent Lon-type protease